MVNHHLVQLHRFLSRQALYTLLLATLLGCFLFAGRVYYSREWTYVFLIWNLFLAWLPYLASLWIAHLHERYPRHIGLLILPGLGWLVFLPNAPYLVTDLIHLHSSPPAPLWYDLGMLLVFAWTGLFLGVFSLRAMQVVVTSYVGSAASWLFVLGVIGLSGLGVYVGRFLRWNSWDLLLQPRGVMADVVERLANPIGHPQTIGASLLFAALLLICYLTVTTVPRSGEFSR